MKLCTQDFERKISVEFVNEQNRLIRFQIIMLILTNATCFSNLISSALKKVVNDQHNAIYILSLVSETVIKMSYFF